MGKVTGFIEFTRELPKKRPPEKRVKDYKEFVERYSDEKLNQQSARCMDCGTPFCHDGCPLGNLIPEFNDAVYRKSWDQAYEILSSTNNFPEFTGRICPAPCESSCVLGINQPAITIEEIERHIIEIAFEKGLVTPKIPAVRTGKKIAIIGSGPAGLAAAAQLNSAGHTVTVFERDDEPGGLLRYGIPDFKLEKWVVERRINLMKEEGVEFKCNANVGVNISINDLLREYHAIILAGGSTIPRDLSIPGRELKGIHFAMEFLPLQNKINAGDIISDQIVATGKDVVIIGGGDTGSDCVGTSNRQGAKSVTQIEVLSMPPNERPDITPWPYWPMILRTSSSHEEGVERKWSINTKSFKGNENGEVTALQCVQVKFENGKFIDIPGTGFELKADLVLIAAGFVHPMHEGMINELKGIGLELDQRGNVKASFGDNENTHATSIEKVFACGDMRRGQSLIVWAIAEGRKCASAVHSYLMQENSIEENAA